MRESAFGLGVAGGIVGFIAAMVEFFIDAPGQATNANRASTVSGLAWLAFVAAVLGIAGDALVKPGVVRSKWVRSGPPNLHWLADWPYSSPHLNWRTCQCGKRG